MAVLMLSWQQQHSEFTGALALIQKEYVHIPVNILNKLP